MPLALSPVSQADIPTLVKIFNAAFVNDPMMLKRFPNGMNDEALAESVAEYADALKDPSCHYLAVTDTETGQIISFARWNEYFNGRPDKEWQEPFKEEKGESAAVRYENEFFNRLYEARRKRWRGNPVSYADSSALFRDGDLTILATAPEQTGRGAASMLIKWGTDRADAANVPVYLEGSPVASGLYRRHGFEQVGEIVIDLSQYKAEGIERTALMLRDPKMPEI